MLLAVSSSSSSSQTSMTKTFWTIEQADERRRGGSECGADKVSISPMLFRLFSSFTFSTYQPHDVVGVCELQIKLRQKRSRKEGEKRRLKEANGKWLVSFCLLTRRALISSFLCVSRAKRKPFCKSCLFELPFHCLAYPVIELISCVSAAKTYAESLVHK